MVRIKAYAKLNLSLFIGEKNQDNYHNIKSLMVSLSLYDTIIIKKAKVDQITVLYDKSIKNSEIKDNIILKAIKEFRDYYHIYLPINVKLYKRIPLSSGLGGESTDASNTILALIKFFKIERNEETIKTLVKKLGSDTTFCVYSSPAIVEGTGEKLTFVDRKAIVSIIPSEKITLFFNDNFQSTKEMFNKIDNYNVLPLDTNPYLFHNDFLEAFLENNENRLLYNELTQKYGICYLSGSGNCLYVFSHKKSGIKNILIKKSYIKI